MEHESKKERAMRGLAGLEPSRSRELNSGAAGDIHRG